MQESLSLDGSPKSDATTFLRNLHDLNVSIGRQFSPILEDRHGIDPRLYLLLHAIKGGTVNPSAIAQAIRLPNSLVTKHLDQLEEKGLLERKIDCSDSRRIRVGLTEEGQNVLQLSDSILVDIVDRRLAHIDEKRRAAFLETLVDLARQAPLA